MNRLQLCQSLMSEADVTGTLTSTTAVNNPAQITRLIGWIDTAWNELQTERDDWGWMRRSNQLGTGMSFTTVAGDATYPLGTGAGTCNVTAVTKWIKDTFRVYPTAVGTNAETFLDTIGYDVWRDGYMYSANRNVQTRPVAVAFGPDLTICLGPPPDGSYTVIGDYYAAPVAMASDTDTPVGLPSFYHMMIVYKAMIDHGYFWSAADVLARARSKYFRLETELERNYMPELF